MELAQLLSMAAFALAASISPGPVNLICLNSGTRHGLSTGLWFVSGATVGFIALFMAIGWGLHAMLSTSPEFALALRVSGIAFLLYLSVMLLRDDGHVDGTERAMQPGFTTGVMMQWLNPKAWMASASGISAYAGGGDLRLTLAFAALYFPICWCSLSLWVVAGKALSRYVTNPRIMRWMNRCVASLLLLSCLYLLTDPG